MSPKILAFAVAAVAVIGLGDTAGASTRPASDNPLGATASHSADSEVIVTAGLIAYPYTKGQKQGAAPSGSGDHAGPAPRKADAPKQKSGKHKTGLVIED